MDRWPTFRAASTAPPRRPPPRSTPRPPCGASDGCRMRRARRRRRRRWGKPATASPRAGARAEANKSRRRVIWRVRPRARPRCTRGSGDARNVACQPTPGWSRGQAPALRAQEAARSTRGVSARKALNLCALRALRPPRRAPMHRCDRGDHPRVLRQAKPRSRSLVTARHLEHKKSASGYARRRSVQVPLSLHRSRSSHPAGGSPLHHAVAAMFTRDSHKNAVFSAKRERCMASAAKCTRIRVACTKHDR